MEFPKAFESRMRCLLGPEYAAFAASYGRPLRPALRVNGLKGTASELAAQLPFTLAPVPWARILCPGGGTTGAAPPARSGGLLCAGG